MQRIIQINMIFTFLRKQAVFGKTSSIYLFSLTVHLFSTATDTAVSLHYVDFRILNFVKDT